MVISVSQFWTSLMSYEIDMEKIFRGRAKQASKQLMREERQLRKKVLKVLRYFCERRDPERYNGFLFYISDKLEEEKKALA